MKTIVFFTCFLFFSCVCNAQKSIIDSLQNILKQHPQQDTITLNAMVDLGFYYYNFDPDKGIEMANKAIQLSQKLHNEKQLATAYNYLGLNYAAQGNDTTAIQFYNKCLLIRKRRNDSKGIGSALHNIGTSYFNLSDYPNALDYQNQALEIFDHIGSQTGMAITLNSIGVIYLFVADYPKALDNYLKALHIYEQTNDQRNIAGTYTNIGLVYGHLDNNRKLLEYQMKALELARKNNDLSSMQNALSNMGNAYELMGDKIKALETYRHAMEINKELGNKRGIASNLINTGILYNKMEVYDTAFTYLNESFNLYRQLNDKYGMSNALMYISNNYLLAPEHVLYLQGIHPSDRYKKAIELQKKGLSMAEEIGDLNTESTSWNNLSNIYLKKKDYNNALIAYKKHITIRDSIMNNEKKSEITRMAMQYDFDKKEATAKAATDKRHALAESEIQQQRIIKNAFAAGGVILLIAGVYIFIIYKRKRDAVEQKKDAEYKAEVAQTEMKALRVQMNPHFIFNSLNSISDYIARHDVKTANLYLGKFAKVMRLILENSEHTEVPLSEDLKALELYMQLEAIRMNDKFTYEIKVDGDIDLENTMVPPLILQPFVENSIWHGIAQKKEGGKILIEIKKEAEMINCMVEDDGIGRNHQLSETGNEHAKKSLGMKITKARIDMLNKLKKTNGSVQLFDIAKGTRVEVRLPLALNF